MAERGDVGTNRIRPAEPGAPLPGAQHCIKLVETEESEVQGYLLQYIELEAGLGYMKSHLKTRDRKSVV